MKYKLIIAKGFEKNLKGLSYTEQKQVAIALKYLQVNPRHPSLRSKKVKGLTNVFESSVNMDIRILWKHKGQEIILVLDVGHHSILDRL